ncbi:MULTISPECIES: hypothetical protein [unclassified Arthrobacter]|uniref:hypothetical protein n=1 Tax=unclassified Arthrobacter TaxID=235627 RepID=UPI003414AAB5
MSAAAATTYPVSTAATARALPELQPGQPARKNRTPLSVVRSVPRRRRAPFVVMCFGLLALALMAVLVLNISVSSAQYQLVELRAKQNTLTKQNQDLTQQVQNYDAPQNLAAKATELGMVASTAKGQIDLSTLSVTGKAKPAAKSDAPSAVIAAPAIAGQVAVVPAPSAQDPLANRKPADSTAAAASATDAAAKTAADAAAAAKQAAEQAAAKAAAAAPAVELHGGSIPAPAQKTPGK